MNSRATYTSKYIINPLNNFYAALALQSLNVGVCIVAHDRHVEYYNQKATHEFTEASHVSLSCTGKLKCTTSKEDDMLIRDTVEIAVSDDTAPETFNRLVVLSNKKTINTTLLLTVQSLHSPATSTKCHGQALVTLSRPQKILSDTTGHQLARNYGLTKAEVDICRWTALGMTGREIATLRRVSYETVRSQTKSVLSKTKCKRRIDLVRLLAFIMHPLFVGN